jgi:hypothetical protein
LKPNFCNQLQLEVLRAEKTFLRAEKCSFQPAGKIRVFSSRRENKDHIVSVWLADKKRVFSPENFYSNFDPRAKRSIFQPAEFFVYTREIFRTERSEVRNEARVYTKNSKG